MWMIDDKSLTLVDGLKFYKGQLFTGVAIQVDADRVVSKVVFENGVRVRDYLPPFPVYPKAVGNQFVGDGLEAFEEPFLRDGVKFSGLLHYFADEECFSEVQYVNGLEFSEAIYEKGEIVKLEFRDQDLIQSFQFDLSKKPISVGLSEYKSFFFQILFHPDELLRILSVDGAYSERVSELGDRVKFHLFDNLEDLYGLDISKSLSLYGDGINKELICILSKNKGFFEIENLSLTNTSLDIDFLLGLDQLKKLSELDLRSKLFGASDLDSLKSRIPSCLIRFNGVEVW